MADRRAVAVPASGLGPGDAITFLLGGLAHVRGVSEVSDVQLSVRCEVVINLHPDDVVMLFDRPAEVRAGLSAARGAAGRAAECLCAAGQVTATIGLAFGDDEGLGEEVAY